MILLIQKLYDIMALYRGSFLKKDLLKQKYLFISNLAASYCLK